MKPVLRFIFRFLTLSIRGFFWICLYLYLLSMFWEVTQSNFTQVDVRYYCLNFEKFRDTVLFKEKSGYIRTFRTPIVEHAIRPNADVKLAGYKAEFIFIPCWQLTFVLTHTRVSVVELWCNGDSECKVTFLALRKKLNVGLVWPFQEFDLFSMRLIVFQAFR